MPPAHGQVYKARIHVLKSQQDQRMFNADLKTGHGIRNNRAQLLGRTGGIEHVVYLKYGQDPEFKEVTLEAVRHGAVPKASGHCSVTLSRRARTRARGRNSLELYPPGDYKAHTINRVGSGLFDERFFLLLFSMKDFRGLRTLGMRRFLCKVPTNGGIRGGYMRGNQGREKEDKWTASLLAAR